MNIIIMAYPVVREDGHGDTQNPRMIFGMFVFHFQWQIFTLFVAGEFFPRPMNPYELFHQTIYALMCGGPLSVAEAERLPQKENRTVLQCYNYFGPLLSLLLKLTVTVSVTSTHFFLKFWDFIRAIILVLH